MKKMDRQLLILLFDNDELVDQYLEFASQELGRIRINSIVEKIKKSSYLTSLPYPIYTEDSTQISFDISYGSLNPITDMYYDGLYDYDNYFAAYVPITTTNTYFDNNNAFDEDVSKLVGGTVHTVN